MSVASEPTQVGRYLFNAHEYMSMFEKGILAEGVRTELIVGEILTMSPANAPHVAVVANLTTMIAQSVGKLAKVSTQSTFHLSEHSMPVPDLVVIRIREEGYSKSLPNPSDCLLLVEVSHTTLKYDREVKLPLYAAANIPEVWIVDLAQRVVEQYTQPEEGRYAKVTKHQRGKRIQATQLAAIDLAVEEIFA